MKKIVHSTAAESAAERESNVTGLICDKSSHAGVRIEKSTHIHNGPLFRKSVEELTAKAAARSARGTATITQAECASHLISEKISRLKKLVHLTTVEVSLTSLTLVYE